MEQSQDREPRFGEQEEDEKRSRGQENLEAKLLDVRVVLAVGPVNDRFFERVKTRLELLWHKDPNKELTIFVNSPGGSADHGFALYDELRLAGCPVRTVCTGLCASAAVLIFLGGDKGKRLMLPNARFLLHQPSTTTYGPASDMEITAKEILRTRRRFAEIVAQEIGSQAEKVMQDSNRDFWLEADEALKYGLVDRVIKNRKELA